MKTFKQLVLAASVAAFCGSASAAIQSDNESWEAKHADQYVTWKSTSEKTEIIDLLEQDPNLVVLFAGYGFSKDYNKARGHYYALTDVVNTLRTGGPMSETDGPMPSSCWSCKTPDVARLYEELGEPNFSNDKWAKWGKEMVDPIGCADCHQSGSTDLTLSRPYADRAMAKVDLKFSEQEHEMQGAQTCGQCHVEYYFDGTDSKNVRFPWENGFSGEGAEQYYDAIGFKDWTHPISKAPMLKAQHPEFETWAPSVHGEMGVTCIDCHMPKSTNDKGQEYTNHNVGNALGSFDSTCSNCHDSKQELADIIHANKEAIETEKLKAEEILVRAHFEAKAAWDAGATEEEMKPALAAIRSAQWRWDFAIASHGIAAHNPQLGLDLLASSQEIGKNAQAELKKVLDKHGVKQPVALPDISTKAKAQAVVGWDKAKLDAQKAAFLEMRKANGYPELN